jgi:hypothetical protein
MIWFDPLGLLSCKGEGEKVPTDVYAFGNRTKPRPPRLGKDIDVKENGLVGPQTPPAGASTFGDPSQAPLTGHYHKLPKDTTLPEGLSIVPDGIDVGGPHRQTHHTIYPNREMPFDEFSQKYRSLPWEYGGKK